MVAFANIFMVQLLVTLIRGVRKCHSTYDLPTTGFKYVRKYVTTIHNPQLIVLSSVTRQYEHDCT